MKSDRGRFPGRAIHQSSLLYGAYGDTLLDSNSSEARRNNIARL